ncbi:nitroreductase family protein [Pseudodesulfovibrio sp.]|uniref:nitroreductase family protein n=1 Tax=unclassified Pseudodesulfovibrio TaxID=2661612 RepID=UPI003AFF6EC1
MSLFTIDGERCVHDGLCAADCPVGCIDISGDGMPVLNEKKAGYCLDCGHCMAICPTGAFQLGRFDAPAVPLGEIGEPVTARQVERFLKSRRSVRAFRAEPVDRDLLARLLDLTEYAPSGHNARPVRWSVARGAEKVQSVAVATAEWMREAVESGSEIANRLHLAGVVRRWNEGVDLICRNAPALAVVVAPERGITPAADAVIAASWLELAAHGAGLGACWAGYVYLAATYSPAVREVLGIGSGFQTHGALLLGYPARKWSAVPPRPSAEVDWL